MSTSITVVVENRASKRDVIAEHGLAVWIQHEDHRILFDTGAGRAIMQNVAALGIDLQKADAIVLSHGHSDHTGGLLSVLKAIGRPIPVYMHPAALQPKFKKENGGSRSMNAPGVNAAALESLGAEIRFTEKPTEVVDGVFVTGQVPRIDSFEFPPEGFFLDEACTLPDIVEDDQSLFFRLDEDAAWAVLFGCAHAGVINTLDYIAELTGMRSGAVFGGMHLINSPSSRIDDTIEAMHQRGICMFGPAHCTGIGMTAALWDRYPMECRLYNTGCTVELS